MNFLFRKAFRHGVLSVWAILLLGMLGTTCAPLPGPPERVGTVLRNPASGRKDTSAQTSGGLNLVTFNIRIGYGSKQPQLRPRSLWQAPKNLGPVIAALRALAPEAAALQEVHGARQAEAIATALGWNFAYTPHSPSGSGSGWGLAVLSPHRILSAHGRKISRGRGNTRSIQIATLTAPGGMLTLINVHTDVDVKDDSSIAAIAGALPGLAGPVALLGDFNMKPGDSRWRRLPRRFGDSALLAGTPGARRALRRGTFGGHTGKPVKRVDYIWVDSTRLRVLDAGLAGATHWPASDHLAYFARVERIR